MTASKTRRSLALALVLGLLLASTPPASGRTAPAGPPAAEVVGGFPFSALGCAGCIGGGVAYALGGWASLLTAAATQGSALAVATCLYWCSEAVAW